MWTDRFGLTASTRTNEALAAYVDGLDLFLSANDGGERLLWVATRLDGDFALPHAALARLHQVNARMQEARAAIAKAEALVAKASAREKSHVGVVRQAIEGPLPAALAAVEAHIEQWPRDGLILGMALGVYGLIAFSGRPDHHEAQRQWLDRLAPAWGEDWWFLGYHGWAYAETGEPKKALAPIETSLRINPRFAHGVHALTHAYFELGRGEEAADYLRAWLPRYAPASQMHCHLNWHLALFDLLAGRGDDADARYRAALQPSVSKAPPMLTLPDVASYLWRRAAYDPNQRDLPWADVLALARRAAPHAGMSFADVHAAMAQAAAGDTAGLEQRVGEMERNLAAGKLAQGAVVPRLCRALGQFAAGDYAAAAQSLDAARSDWVRVAGSHAQRELFEDTLIIALMRSGGEARARAILAERLKRRPRPLDRAWLKKAGG